MLHIAIVGRALGSEAGGVGEYVRSIVSELLRLESPHRFTIYLADPRLVGRFPAAREVCLKAPHKFFWDHLAVPRQLEIDQPDAVWYPHNVVALRNRWPAVVTIYDLLYFRDPQFPIREYALLDTMYMRAMIPRSVRSATRIVAISNWTAKGVSRLFGVPRQGVKTIYPAVSAAFRELPAERLQEVRQRHGLDRPFFLYVGGLSARKNLRRLVKAFAKIANQIPHDLVVTGAGEVPAVEVGDLIRAMGLGDRYRKLGAVPQEDLVALYNLAEALVYPSLYEGFGLPPLEAFACDCPVITSNRTALAEVVGEAALLIDPCDTEDLARAMRRVIDEAKTRRRLIEHGRNRLELFSWRRSAQEMLTELELAAGRTVGAPPR